MPCLPHQFQCSSQECLDPALVCNGFSNCADGSDEGGSCQTTCTEEEKSHCSQSCYSTPQGTVKTANINMKLELWWYRSGVLGLLRYLI